MKTPEGNEEFSCAELFIQLPGSWPHGASVPPDKSWVIDWMRRIADYPHANQTWLGGTLAIVDNEDPPRPLGPDLRFTSWLLFAETSFESNDSRIIQLYRMMPLYKEERDLERRDGGPALMRAFDRASVPFVVDFRRDNVALQM